MAKPKPSYQQRLFNDEELITSSHDEIVRWADISAKKRPDLYLNILGIDVSYDERMQPCAWNKDRLFSNITADGHGTRLDTALQHIAKIIDHPLDPPPALPAAMVAWERPIKNERQTVIGFVDLSVIFRVPTPIFKAEVHKRKKDEIDPDKFVYEIDKYAEKILCCDGQGFYLFDERKYLSEIPRKAASLYGPCVIYREDVYSLNGMRWVAEQYSRKDIGFLVEAKTKLTTAGELIRQINLYRMHAPSHHFIVVAPASQWHDETRQIVEENGIHPITYLSN